MSSGEDTVLSVPSLTDEATAADPLAPDRLDAITYRLIALGFILLTLTIITGAAWAQYTWHKWWSWDPKETSALVAWLVYLVYLHGRLLGWRKPLVAWIAVLGAFGVVFCYAGVNFLGGMHSYGATTQNVLEGARHAFTGMQTTEAGLAMAFLACYLAGFMLYLATAVFSGVLSVGRPTESSPPVRNRRLVSVLLLLPGALPTLAGFILHTIALVYRSVLIYHATHAVHLPFSSGYEYAACFAWAMALVFLILQLRIPTPVLGAAAMPFILLVLAYGFLWFGNKGVEGLPPALQNRFWLHLHVAIAIVSYAALIIATATSAIYLVRSMAAMDARARWILVAWVLASGGIAVLGVGVAAVVSVVTGNVAAGVHVLGGSLFGAVGGFIVSQMVTEARRR